MAEDDSKAPYAPTKTVMKLIDRYRDRGLPDPLETKGLELIGVPDSMAPRTLRAMKFLKLIDETGHPTQTFERLKRATSDEYPGQLREIVQAAYLPVFSIVDPAKDGDLALADAFRQYEPSAQRDKMISLFRGLCENAGIIESRGHPRAGGRKPKVEGAKPQTAAKRQEKPDVPPPPPPLSDPDTPDLSLVSAIIRQLPRERRWSADRRSKWLSAMTSAVDLLIEVDGSTEGGGS